MPSGTSGTLVNQFRYEPVSISLLTGQTYYIGALWIDGSDNNLFPGGTINFGTAPEVNFVANQFVSSGTLAFPGSSADSEPAYFGPNFEFGPTTTPEPTTGLLFLCAAASFGIGKLRRKSA